MRDPRKPSKPIRFRLFARVGTRIRCGCPSQTSSFAACCSAFPSANSARVGILPPATEFATRPPDRRAERCGPRVLVDEHRGRASGIEHRTDLLEVLLGQQDGQVPLDLTQPAERTLVDVTQLGRVDRGSSSFVSTRRSSARIAPLSISALSAVPVSPVKSALPEMINRGC